MRLAVWPNLQQPWDDVLGVVRHAEATGWDGAYVADHFMGDGSSFGAPETPTLEATAALAALAGATERLRLAPLVLGTTYRHPAVVAKWASTVDHASGGRLCLGIGAGWQVNEHEQYGIDLPPVRERVDRFGEVCEVLHGLLRSERTAFHGRWFDLDDALCEPKPLQDPLPLLIGAKGDRMLGLVARWADEWNMWGLPEALAERAEVLARACERIDRDPTTIRRSTQALVLLTDDAGAAERFLGAVAPRAAYAGTAEGFAELVGRWREVGIDEVIVPDFVLGRGQRRLEALDALREATRPLATG